MVHMVSLAKLVPKQLVLREEDYWLLPVSILTEIFIAAALYASVLMFRLPVVILSAVGLWFTTIKVRKGYGGRHARYHLVVVLTLGALFFTVLFLLTN